MLSLFSYEDSFVLVFSREVCAFILRLVLDFFWCLYGASRYMFVNGITLLIEMISVIVFV